MSGPASRWRARNLGAAWQMTFFQVVIRFGGRPLAYFFSDLVSLGYVCLRADLRARCRPYLSRRFPTRGPLGRLWDAWHLVRTFARLLVDRKALTMGRSGQLHTQLAGRDDLLNLLGEGRGLVLVTSHVGAWQLGLQSLGSLERPVAVLARPEEGPGVDPFASAGFRRIDPAGFLGGVPELLAVLQAGGIVCIMGDRALGATVTTSFLGDPVPLPFSPYKLAGATGAPLAVLFPYKPAPDQYEMKLAACLRVPEGLGRSSAAYEPWARQYAQCLEQFLEDHPYEFFNFFDLWTPPEHP